MVSNLELQNKIAILLVSHGSSLPFAETTFNEIKDKFNKATGFATEVGYMKVAQPSISGAVENLKKEVPELEKIIAIPVFLAPGIHTNIDIPTLLGLSPLETDPRCPDGNYPDDHYLSIADDVDFNGDIELLPAIGPDDDLLEVINKRITGNLNVIKVDDNNTPIKGVKFEIYDANKNKVDTITTDENGKAASKDLQIGTYTYKEVSVPKGYVIDENEYEFAVTSKETKIEKTVVNNRAKGALKIIKLEKGTKTPIEGVTFEILDENKNVVDTIVTNKDGIAEKQDLIVGKYYYREISAPDKYIVDSKEKSFKLTDNGEIFEATVYNEAKTLPVTGGSLSLDMLIVLMVAGFSIVGFTTMKVVKEKKEHNL